MYYPVCIFDLMPCAIFRARDWFHVYKIFDPCWQKTGSSCFCFSNSRWRFYHSKNSADTGRNSSPKIPGLENMVSVVAHSIQAAIAFGELSNLYGISHYPGGTLHLFYWLILAKAQNKRFPWNPIKRTTFLVNIRLWCDLSWFILFRPWSLALYIVANNPLFVAVNNAL